MPLYPISDVPLPGELRTLSLDCVAPPRSSLALCQLYVLLFLFFALNHYSVTGYARHQFAVTHWKSSNQVAHFRETSTFDWKLEAVD